MTISLSKEQEAHLQNLVKKGKFDSPEHFVSYALHTIETEDELFANEAFVKRVKAALQEARENVADGRVRTYNKGNHQELFDDIQRRGMERLQKQK